MATLYGRGRGKSGSHRPLVLKPIWLKRDAKEVREIIIKLAKEDYSLEKIGLALRDRYGIPISKAVTGKRIKKILEEEGLLKKPSDLVNLIKRAIKLKKHLEKNKQDKVAKRGLQLTESKILRLAKYYKKKNMLQQDWKYTDEKI